MGSFNGKGRSQGRDSRRGAKGQRHGLLKFESLEDRVLLASSPWQPTSVNLADVKAGPMANAGQDLINVYQTYLNNGGDASQVANKYTAIQFQGGLVGVDVKWNGSGDFNGYITTLRNLGMQVSTTNATYGVVEGYLPIPQLVTVAASPQTSNLGPVYKPLTGFTGVANNEADAALKADVARQQFKVDGTGVTVGVLSDSINQASNLGNLPPGLAGSVQTGDLPANVQILSDGSPGDTDEGRAMLENIHDIAPGAGLAFATANGGVLTFGQNIQALATQAKANVIVDDVRYLNEPYFQDGFVAQGVNAVVAGGATYVSAAHNEADHGYLSQFRGTQATVGSLGAGRYMDFDPGSGVTTQLPITVQAGAIIGFQYDQPFNTQQPVGSTGDVSSDLDFYILDANGQIVAASTSNNLATHEPFEAVQVPTAGNYTVVIKLVSGPDPGHVEFLQFSNQNAIPSQQFGNAGGTFYPTTYGHMASQAAIGVGAVPWWAPAPFLGQSPLKNEPFSSFGPALSVFNPDGTPKASPQTVLAPVISGADGGNTSFFGSVIDTSNPPFPGQPATTSNLSQPLPSFFGTSSASPNIAAVAALMKQLDPTLTPTAIRNALIASAEPMNGAAPSTWNPQGGYGYVNAVTALDAVNQLRVIATTPANGAVATVSPGILTLAFNRPVNFASVSPADLTFTALPFGLPFFAVGAPIPVDNPLFPTVIAFPLSVSTLPGSPTSGVFAYTFQGPVVGQDGKPLVPFNGSFNLQDVTGPRITSTTISGRLITIQFNEGLQAGSISRNTIQLVRAGGVSNGFGQPGNVLVTQDPRVKVTYSPLNNSVVLDLSALDQASLPTDRYRLVVSAGDDNPLNSVTDLAGNRLDGDFNGIFPSGNGLAGGTFIQELGVQTLLPPTVSAVVMDPTTDTGITGDENTKLQNPVFQGQVASSFPGTLANLTVLAEFNGLHNGAIDLAPGPNGRGFVGNFDVVTTTDQFGHFTIQAPILPPGFNLMRIVVIAASDVNNNPLTGPSSSFDHTFRIDVTGPFVGLNTTSLAAVSLTPGGTPLPLSGTNLASLSTLSLDMVDPSVPAFGSLLTPPQVLFPAIDPRSAANLANYSLFNVTTGTLYNQFITSAKFVPTDSTFGLNTTPKRISATDPFLGRIDLTFKPGLPAGNYQFMAANLLDAAGNVQDNTPTVGSKPFFFNFGIQSQPVFITNLALQNSYGQPDSVVIGGPRSYFEVPAANATPRAPTPPKAIVVDFSTPLDPTLNYSNAVQLIASADTAGGTSDGDFGTLGEGGQGSGNGNSRVPNVTVTLVDPTGRAPGSPGFAGTRLVLTLPANQTLAPDKYRIYMPNSGANVIRDIFGNQLDGEFVGNPTATGAYESLLPNGQYRFADLSGDGVAGGAFTTGFVVVPNGNIIFARPDYTEDPLNPATYADGSLAKPYPVLAPQATATAANGGNLNAPSNFFDFDPNFDRAGIRKFASSAFYAAQVAAANGPVVLVALPAPQQRDPLTGVISQKTFVLQAPAGPDPVINDGSASVPFDTTLVFTPGTTLKLANASLFVQNQGSALQTLGGANPNDRVTFTSYSDDAVAGDTNRDSTGTIPRGGDWGGIVLRNFNNAIHNNVEPFPVDGTLKGASGQNAVSGADDTLSILNYTDVRYAGGAVPATRGIRYDAITLYNSRPTISNDNITVPNGSTAGAQAAISGDLDSFREDDIARGVLVRRTTVANYSLNGIWVRPNLVNGISGVAEETDAINYPDNPVALGGTRNFTFDDPLPYILTSQLLFGERMLVGTGGQTTFTGNRAYIQPGMMFKSQRGAGIGVVNGASFFGSRPSSINVGVRTYINQFDADPNFTPNSPGYKTETADDAEVLFTSIFDNTATTSFIDPVTGVPTIIVPAIDSGNSKGVNQPAPGNVPDIARWSSVGIVSGAIAVINHAEFRYGGGQVNGPDETLPSQSVLAFITNVTALSDFSFGDQGTRAIVTHNDFFDNLDTAMQIEPNGLLAADPLRPLLSGNPFFRDNLMQRNDIDGMAVVTSRTYVISGDRTRVLRPREGNIGNGGVNLTVNGMWDDTDLTYVLRGTVVLDGYDPNFSVPSGTGYVSEIKPAITLTLQSALPGTLLPDGETVARPGESVLVKMLNDNSLHNSGSLDQFGSTGSGADTQGGAGFIVGVDDNVDPPAASPAIDPGVGSQIRITGIGGNETTGQERVPVILTSLRDNTVGKTVRGITQNKIYNNDPLQAANFDLNTPAAGDGGYILIGGNSLTDYNLFDPRDGSLIDNADIRYMTRIEVQGSSLTDSAGSNTTPPPIGQFEQEKLGLFAYAQVNSDQAMTISNSNLSSFADAAVFVHPAAGNAWLRTIAPDGSAAIIGTGRSSLRGEGVTLFMVNNTITNSAVGIHINSETSDATADPSQEKVVLLNNTFYNNPIALHSVAPTFSSPTATPRGDSVYWFAMDNIFANSSNTALISEGQQLGSQAQYNLYNGNATNLTVTAPGNPYGFGGFLGNFGAIVGNPSFRDPAAGDFGLNPDSAAIDAARSEMGPLQAGDLIFPAVIQALDATGGVRTPNAGRNFSVNGFFGGITDPEKVTLPGTPGRGFVDEWVAVLPNNPQGIAGPATNGATFLYQPIEGERDLLGRFRQDDPNVANVGFGSRPFFEVGAREFRQFFPPQVVPFSTSVNVSATLPDGSTRDLYSVGGIAGTNAVPQSINIRFNHQIDPNTINGQSVLLVGSGGDGQFGNGNDVPFNLTGKVSFNPSTLVMTIVTAGLSLPTDEYLITLVGNGAVVLRDTQGNALDGENTPSPSLDPNATQGPLPSGNGFPGGNFFMRFTVDQHAPMLVPNSLRLDPSTDTNRIDSITTNQFPIFSGKITDVFPPTNPLQGATVFIDVFNYTTGQWDQVGSGVTDINGNFSAPVTVPLPDSPYNVGPDGLLGTADDTGLGLARARVVDQSGNVSNLFTDPLSDFVAKGATANYIVDTQAPLVTGFSPAFDAVVTSGTTTISFTTDKNLDPSTINASTVVVLRAGPDGLFGTADDVGIPLTGTNFPPTPVPLQSGPKGPETFSFDLPSGLPNDQYLVALHGSGSNAITDIAGNPLAGVGVKGTDLVFTFVINNPATNKIIYVGPSFITDPTAPQGSRANPFPTINEGIAAAGVGDFVAVLPGVYTENVNLKSLVRVYSADPSSTDSDLQRGNALQTVIRAPFVGGGGVTVTADNLFSANGLYTELDGFTIASPLFGSQATGSLDPFTTGVAINNSTIVLSSNYIITSGVGVKVTETGINALVPYIQSNVITGNGTGIYLDGTAAGSVVFPINIDGNSIAHNQVGLTANLIASSPILADIGNNIFWENHDLSPARIGTGVLATVPNKIALRSNLFSGNGPNDASPLDDVIGVGGGFDVTRLGPTPDQFNNFTGDPAFVAPRDPRPGADGPAGFFLDANYDLTAASAAIDAAIEGFLPAFDLLHRSRVDIPGRGLPGTGPGDIGAFEFNGVGGLAAGGTFRVASTSLADGGGALASGRAVNLSVMNNSITINFSGPIDPNTVDPSDLILSGSGLDPTNPAHAVGFNVVNDHTITFLLAGGFNSSGVVNVSIPAGAILSKFHESMLGFSDSAQIAGTSTTPTSPTTPVSPAPSPAPAPARRRRRAQKVQVGKKHPAPRPPKRQQRQVVHRPKKAPVKVHHPKTQFGVAHPKRRPRPFVFA